MKLSKLEPLMAVILLVLVYIASSRAGKIAAGFNVTAGKEMPVVVIDAGQPDTPWGRKKNYEKCQNSRPETMAIIYKVRYNVN